MRQSHYKIEHVTDKLIDAFDCANSVISYVLNPAAGLTRAYCSEVQEYVTIKDGFR